jgi:lipoprotein-anchoring transpeptidase ErfK/SrfK
MSHAWIAGLLAAALATPSAALAAFGPARPAAPAAHPAKAGAPATTRAKPRESRLKPGDYVWTPELSAKGPMVMFVSLHDQEAYVYRDGVRIGVSTISSGRTGYETPVGVFEVVQKQLMHHSNLYDDAPMPFMQRLTWDGLALHAGHVRGHPASHGCVRMPDGFAKALYAEATRGMTVVIAERALGPPVLETRDMLTPLDRPRAPETTSQVAALDDDGATRSQVRIDDGDLAGARVLRTASREPTESPPGRAVSAADLGIAAIATARDQR